MNIQSLARNTQRIIMQNSPLIFTSVAVAGVITSGILAVRATPAAMEKLDEARTAKYDAGHEEPLTVPEIFKASYKCYIPAAAVGGMTIASIILSHNIASRRNAALVGAYSVVETAFDQYKKKSVEIHGENQERKVREGVAEEKFKETPVGSREVIVLAGEGVLCHDEWSGRYFTSTMQTLQKAENEVNRQCINNMYCSQNEFYSLVGLSPIENGDFVGWSTDHVLRLDITTMISEDSERPCFSVGYHELPSASFSSLR